MQAPQSPSTLIKLARLAFEQLQLSNSTQRNQGIIAMANDLEAALGQILEANTLDLLESREMAVPEVILNWLKLTPERLKKTVKVLKQIARLPDPLQKSVKSLEQLGYAQAYLQHLPLGVIGLIYEALPELGAITAAMALKTGNTLILRGSSESYQTNKVIVQVLQQGLQRSKLSSLCVQLLAPESHLPLADFLKQESGLSLAIPYGRLSLVEQVTSLATVPVLGAAMGNCYLYWSSSGETEQAAHLIIDSHDGDPDAVNALEKVLINTNHSDDHLTRLFKLLQEQHFQLQGEQDLVDNFPDYLTLAPQKIWNKPSLKKIVTFAKVEDIDTAIERINRDSSGHANCIVTESYQESRLFATKVDTALVYLNCSPRFSRLAPNGEGVFLGVTAQKDRRRGFISLESLTTFKEVIQG